MIEFEDEGGGRYLFTDDILNLQDLALSITEMFDDCDNFIVSGCEVSSKAIGSGYVYIDGKIRYYEGASASTWPQYIYATDTEINVEYKSDTKLGRTKYSASSSSSAPSDVGYITVTSSGGPTIGDAFLSKYSLLLSSDEEQTISSDVSINGNVSINGSLSIEDIRIDGDHIYLNGEAGVDTMYINFCGYDGGTDYYRNLRIGDGKGNTIVRTNLDADEPAINVYSALNLSSNALYALRLSDSEHEYDDEDLSQMIVFGDSNGYTTGRIGFGSTSDNSFYIENWLGNVQITACNKEYDDDGNASNGDNSDCYVNISPAIKENGTLLSEKYEAKVEDSGWKAVYTNGDYVIYMRQIGSIVCLQGTLYINGATITTSDTWELDGITPPYRTVLFYGAFSNGYSITLKLTSGSTQLQVETLSLPDSGAFAFPFSMTYMAAD